MQTSIQCRQVAYMCTSGYKIPIRLVEEDTISCHHATYVPI